MCGRSCCTLDPEELQENCLYKFFAPKNLDALLKPNYVKEYNLGKTYQPSYNVAPTDITLVLTSKAHISLDEKDNAKRSLVPMMWGIVPRWHKGECTKHGFHTNNARLEGLMESRIFKQPFIEGKRCVVLCEGFYEWSTVDPDKTPYFIHAEQKSSGIRIEDRSTWPEDQAKDLVLLKMAGIFDVWSDEKADQMWAYSVLTRESDDVLSWLHHRTPVFLETEQQVSDWLDFNRVGPEEALAQLNANPVKNLVWHQVSKQVNKSRYKEADCNKPMVKTKISGKNSKIRITDFFQAKSDKTKET